VTFNEVKTTSQFKANIFVDWLNVKANGGSRLDFFKLIDMIRDTGGIICRANIYMPEPDERQVPLYDMIKKAGFKVIIIPPKSDGVNCDALMAVDMVTQSLYADVIYLLSNDADFIPAVEYLQSIGKRVLLIHGESPSNRLRRTVDEWRRYEQLHLLKERKAIEADVESEPS